MKVIHTTHAPAPGGHYSQGLETAGLLFVAGQLPLDPATGKLVSGSVRDEARQALANLRAVVEAAGLQLKDVVKTTVYVAGIEHWPQVNEVYAEVFGAHRPARSVVPCLPLHYNAKVEIEAIARAPQSDFR